MAIDFRAALMDELDPSQRSKNTGIAGNLAGSGQLPVVGTPIDPTNGGGINGENLPSGAPDAKPAIAATPSTVNLAGWDPTRTDNAGKYKFGRAVQDAKAQGQTYNADWVRQFVAQNPNEWELDPRSSANDPHIRQKQSWLDNPQNGDPKTGQRSVYQDVLGDAGGANIPQFSNVEGDPSLGYAAPQQASTPGGLSDVLAGDPTAGIQSALGGLSKQGDFLTQLLAALQGTAA